MRRLILSIVSPIIFLFAVVTVAPQFIDWNKFKPTVTEKIKTATGYDLAIDGNLSLSIFPRPIISADNISIAAPGAEPVLKAARTDIQVKFIPLLHKQVHITGMTVKSPVITVITDENGNRNIISSDAAETKSATSADIQAPASAGFMLDKTAIENGTLTYENRLLKTSRKITEINTIFTSESLQGPFSAAGDLVYNGDKIIFSADTGTVIPGNPASANISLKHQKSDTELQIAGDFTVQPEISLKGSIALTSVNSGSMMQFAEIPSALVFFFDKGNLDLNAGVSFTPAAVSVTDITLVNKRTAVTGKAKFTFSSAEKRSSLSFDLVSDRLGWEKVSSDTDGKLSAATPPVTVGKNFEDLLATGTGILISPFSTGTDMDGKITVGTLTVYPYSAKNAVLHIAGTDGRLQLKELKATLPESTVFSASASLSPEDKSITGSFSFKSAAANSFIRSMGKNISLPSDDFAVDGTVILKPQSFGLPSFRLVNGDGSVNGSFIFNREADTPFTVVIETSKINLDMFKGKPDDKSSSEAGKQSPKISYFTERLGNLKSAFKISSRDTVLNGKKIGLFRTAGILDNLYLDISDMYLAQGDGTKLSAGGTIGDISTLKSTDIDILIQSEDFSSFVKTFASDFKNDNLKKANLKMAFIGDPELLKIDFGGTINGTALRLHGSIKDAMQDPSFELKTSANHTETVRMITDLAGYKPRGVGIGRFFAEAKLYGSQNKFSISDLDIQIGDAQSLKGQLSYVSRGGFSEVKGKLTGTSINIGDLMPETPATKQDTEKTAAVTGKDRWADKEITLDFLKNISGGISAKISTIEYGKFILTNPTLDLSFSNGTITLNNLGTGIFGGAAGVKGAFTVGSDNTAHKGIFNIAVERTDVVKFFEALGQNTFSKGTLDYSQSIGFAGRTQKEFIASLSGKGNLNVTDAVVNGMDLNKLSQTLENPTGMSDFTKVFDTLTAGGTTPFETITAPVTIQNGIVSSSDIAMKSSEVSIGITGVADLPNWTVNARGQINFVSRSNIPPLGMTVSGSLDNPKKQIDRNLVATFAKQKVGNLIGKVLGGKNNKTTTPDIQAPTAPVSPTVQPLTPQPSTAVQTQQQTPEQQLKDAGKQLLNNLLNGKKQ